MAICNALSGGLSKSCDTNAGGLKRVLVGDYTDFSLTYTSGVITSAIPATTDNIISTSAEVTSDTLGPTRDIVDVRIPGDETAIFTPGRWFYFTFNVKSFDGTTTSSTSWSGSVLSSSYDSGANKTIIVPDFQGFTPLVGPSAFPAPTNTNQTVKTYAIYEISTNKNVCNFTETTAIDMANGTTFYNQVVTVELARRETTKRDFIEKLIAGQKALIVVIQDSNGLYFISGLTEGSYVTAIEGGSGTAKADKNGYTLTFTAMEPEQAYEISSGAVDDLVIS